MLNEIQQVVKTAEQLYSAAEVEAAITKMAQQINAQFADKNPLVLCVINGGIVVAGQLLTQLNFPLNLDVIHASRYHDKTLGSEIKWIQTPRTSMQHRCVLIIDDILDEGITLEAIYEYCRKQGAAELYSAVLVDKNLGRVKPVTADFIGLTTENYYLFGYGLDYKGYLRNSAGIFACKETA